MSHTFVTVQKTTFRVYQSLRQQTLNRDFTARVILLLLIHIPLGLFFQWNAIFGTIHALATLGIGLLFIISDKTPERLLYVVAYVTGAELLWRGTEARVFYEYGKYATILLLALGILKYSLINRAPKWPLVYFVLLLPAIFVLPRFDREDISFNLAGPLALAVATIFFSTLFLTGAHLQRTLLALLIPAVSLGSLVAFGIISTDTLAFGSASNFQTSADIGPNQVSSVLGLGAVASFLLALLMDKQLRFLRVLFGVLSLWLFLQTMLTYSRGGFWTAIGALVFGGAYFIQNTRARIGFLTLSLAVFALGYFVLLPILDKYTGNTLQARFEDFETTGRIEIIHADWLTFLQYPVFGVGPNQSKPFHALTYRYASAHTEYSRLLSEHGIFGLFALLILIGVSAHRLLQKDSKWQKSLSVTFTIWALLFMTHAATRLVAPSLLFGLASARFFIDQHPSEK